MRLLKNGGIKMKDPWFEHYLSSISSSVRRARALLLSISLIGAWVIASQLVKLVGWSNVRTPASYNIGFAADKKLSGLSIKVTESTMRPAERNDLDIIEKTVGDSAGCKTLREITAYYKSRFTSLEKHAPSNTNQTGLTFTTRLDSIICRYPSGKSFQEKVDWCKHYYMIIANQSDDSKLVSLVEILADRGTISPSKLPGAIMSRPNVEVPLVGLSVGYDDISVVGAVILLFAMLWFRFSMHAVHRNIDLVRLKYPYESRAFSQWVLMQFVFIPLRKGAPNPPPKSAFLLFFVPYIAVLISLSQDIYEILWQILGYSIVTGIPGEPVFNSWSTFWFGQATGITALRIGILIFMLLLLNRESWIAWSFMSGISYGRSLVTSSEYRQSLKDIKAIWRSLFRIITWFPILVVAAFLVGRSLSLLFNTFDPYGWTYGLSLVGTVITLVLIALEVTLIYVRILPRVEQKLLTGNGDNLHAD
jgi:hypothetical protein